MPPVPKPKDAPGAKTCSLTFSSPDENALYAQLAKAAAADDRSINSFIVRVLLGKEEFAYAPANESE